jgi:hypothetical protein
MPKLDSELPADISARLEEAISTCLADLRAKVQHMFRFSNMDEVDAARIVLAEKGEPMHVDAIVQELKAGGFKRRYGDAAIDIARGHACSEPEVCGPGERDYRAGGLGGAGMNVAELITELQKHPPEMQVCLVVPEYWEGDHTHEPLETIRSERLGDFETPTLLLSIFPKT